MAEPPYKQSIEFRQNFCPFSGWSKSNFPISYILKGINYWIAEILYSTSFHDIDVTNVRKGNYQSCQSPMTFQSHCILHCEGSSGGGVTLQINPNGFSQVVGGPETPCSAYPQAVMCVSRLAAVWLRSPSRHQLTQASKHQLTSNDQLTQASRQQQHCNFDLVMSGTLLSLASSHPKLKFSSSKSNSQRKLENWKLTMKS